MKKYYGGGVMDGEPTNRDMRESDRASRESYRMSRAERRLGRNREDVDRLLADLEGYEPESQDRRDMARKMAALGLGAAALPVGVGMKNAINDARSRAMMGRSNTIFDAGNSIQDLSAIERLLIDILGMGGRGGRE